VSRATSPPGSPPALGSPPTIAELPSMSLDKLRTLWACVFKRRRAPPQRWLLLRELAWRIQEEAHGGLDASTRTLLNAAIRAASAGRSLPASSTADAPPTTAAARAPARSKSRPSVALPPESRLVRTWRGVKHEVLVLRASPGGGGGPGGEGNERFIYRGKEFQSLSRIAREITGTHLSGPRFFGVTTRSRRRAQGGNHS
jgi:hypothetical protein